MSGELDLARMLASLDVERRPGTFTYVTGDWPGLLSLAHAIISETEGVTYIVTVDNARSVGAPVEFEAAWLTLTVWSSLEAVGLTAAVSGVLADAGIACNIIAGFHHDHLLVPADQAERATRLLKQLSVG